MSVARYSLLLVNPTIDRLDTVVAGVVVRRDDSWDVRVATSAQKMKAIDPTFPDQRLVQTSELVREMAQHASTLSELQQAFRGARLGLLVDQFVGNFVFEDDADYQREVSAVLAESVNPPTLASANAAPVSRRRNVVGRNLRGQFKARGLWSRNHLAIEQHLVVEHFPISSALGVIADFALKNSVMHITETIDFEIQSPRGKRIEAQAKALVLTEAIKVFGSGTKRYVVAAGTANPSVAPSVMLLSEHAAVFALESDEDMKSYVDQIAAAAAAAVSAA